MAKKKKVVVKKFGKKKKTSADRPVPRDKKKVPPTRRPVKDAPKKVEKKKVEKTKKPVKPVPKKVAKPVRKAKPVKKKVVPKKKQVKAKPVPKKKVVRKAKPVKKTVPKKVAKPVTKKKRTKKEKVQVPPKLGWPPPGTVVDGKVKYVVPAPGGELQILKQDKFVPKAHFAAGTVVPGSQPDGTPKKGSNEGVIITLKKGVDGWPANIRVTRDDVLVVNIFNKTWKAALEQLRVNYGFGIMLPNLV